MSEKLRICGFLSCLVLCFAFSSVVARTIDTKCYNLYRSAILDKPLAVDSLQALADAGNKDAVRYLGWFYYYNNKSKSIDYLLSSADDGDAESARLYANLLSNSNSDFRDSVKFESWARNWREHMLKEANDGNPNAMCAVGQMYTFYTDVFRHDDEEGNTWLLKAAIAGNPEAQFFYHFKGDMATEESRIWLKTSADNGYWPAKPFWAKALVDGGNFAEAIDCLEEYIREIPADRKIDDYVTPSELLVLAKFIKDNPEYSLSDYGPVKEKSTPYYFSKRGKIIACATYRGKAGLLKLDKNGNRIDHDDIPFIYDYIIPLEHEMMRTKFNIYFQPNPYVFRTPKPEFEIMVLDSDGKETSFSMYSSYQEMVELPDKPEDYYDSED